MGPILADALQGWPLVGALTADGLDITAMQNLPCRHTLRLGVAVHW